MILTLTTCEPLAGMFSSECSYFEVKVQETVYNPPHPAVRAGQDRRGEGFPPVQVLDRAVPAERPSKPKIRLNMAVAGATSLLLGALLAFFLEYQEGLKRRLPPTM